MEINVVASRARAFDTAGSAGTNEFPTSIQLGNYPNPFNPTTTISYALPERTYVQITVFNTLGQQVAVLVDGSQEAGERSVSFDATGLPSGLYLYRLTAGKYVETRKLVVLR